MRAALRCRGRKAWGSLPFDVAQECPVSETVTTFQGTELPSATSSEHEQGLWEPRVFKAWVVAEAAVREVVALLPV